GIWLNGLLALPLLSSLTVAEARVLSTAWSLAPTILPKTVKPPFCVSRLDELFPRLKKNWLVALFGSPPSLAMARVPWVLEMPNSFCTAGSVATALRLGVGLAVNWKPPPCKTKGVGVLTRRWKMVLAYRLLLT